MGFLDRASGGKEPQIKIRFRFGFTDVSGSFTRRVT